MDDAGQPGHLQQPMAARLLIYDDSHPNSTTCGFPHHLFPHPGQVAKVAVGTPLPVSNMSESSCYCAIWGLSGAGDAQPKL